MKTGFFASTLMLYVAGVALSLVYGQLPAGDEVSAIDLRYSDAALPQALPIAKQPDLVSTVQSSPQDQAVLTVAYTGSAPLQMNLLQSTDPIWLSSLASKIRDIDTPFYGIVGEVSYENVSPGSYLEMWSHFDASAPTYFRQAGTSLLGPLWVKGHGPASFSRTLAETGPLGRIEGSSGWRAFWLPFDQTDATSRLHSLELNLHLTGPGTVHFRRLKLMAYYYLPELIPQPNPQEQILAKLGPFYNSNLIPVPGQTETWELGTGPSAGMWILNNPPITTSKFAIVGEVSYRELSNAFFALSSRFAPEIPESPALVYDTNDDLPAGPMGKLAGNSDWRTFWLPFDAKDRKSRLIDLSMYLRMADPHNPATHVLIRNVRLVQYLDGTFPAAMAPDGKIPSPTLVGAAAEAPVAAPSPEPQPSPGSFDRRSFLLGIAATFFALILIGGCFLLLRRLRHRSKERELRRIASLDG